MVRTKGIPVKSSYPKKRRQLLITKAKHPGTVAVSKITNCHEGADLLMNKLIIQNLVKEAMSGSKTNEIQESAILVLHEAAESYLVSIFADANLCAGHAQRRTVVIKDLALAIRIRGQRESFHSSSSSESN